MKSTLTIFTLFFIVTSMYAQLDSVIVEKYYISDANDAKYVQAITDENTGDTINTVILEEGSVTYRVYIQLAHGYKLIRIYGDANHPLEITSTANFFNNILDNDGESFGYQIPNNHINLNTVALDTWLTLGQANNKNFGVLKAEDTNGSIVGGTHDRDSLLKSKNPAAGIPITDADGLAPIVTVPSNWQQTGIVNISGNDSTIFGSLKAGEKFISNNASLQNNGVMGVDTGNYVLVAQLTTKGDISFKLNVQVIDTLNPRNPISFVADTAPGDYAKGYLHSKFLTYPRLQVCGCNNPNYLEYKPDRDCNDSALCMTKIVFGCMDPQACNYDPKANIPINSLCCYPGSCAARDISIVCPDLGKQQPTVNLYPNPVNDKLEINISNFNSDKALLSIYDIYGKKFFENNISTTNNSHEVNVSSFVNGIYLLRVQNSEGVNITRYWIKN